MLSGRLTRIRPLEVDDIELLYEWYQNPEFTYWVSGSWPQSSFLRLENIERQMYEEDEHRYALTDDQNNLLGTVGFDQVNIPARSARIYIGIGRKDYWAKGYGSDALAVFIEYLFQQWNFRRLTAETWQENTRALACYHKLGFIREGTLREAYYVAGKYYDAIIMGLLKRDFTGFQRF